MASLDTLNWDSLTQREAARLVPHALKRHNAACPQFEREEITESEFLASYTLYEDLRVYALCG